MVDARAIGADLVDHLVDAETPVAALKFILRTELDRFDRAVVLDTDIVIRAGAPSLFDLVPDTHLGVVREERHLDRGEWLDRMVALYDVSREHGSGTPYFNSGVMVLSRRHYSLLSLPKAGTLYAYPLFEQTYLNARVRALGIPLYELPKEFNYISDYDAKMPPDWRYGWLIHLAGSWDGQRRTHSFWRETAKLQRFQHTQPAADRVEGHPRPPKSALWRRPSIAASMWSLCTTALRRPRRAAGGVPSGSLYPADRPWQADEGRVGVGTLHRA